MLERLNIRAALAVLLVGFGSACATVKPTEQLVSARAAYEDASKNDATAERPDEMVDAKRALEAAEAAHREDPGSAEERHLAYLAERRAQLAIARGKTASYERTRAAKREQLLQNAKQNAEQSRSQLTETRRSLNEKEQALAEERAMRKQAEAKAAAALQDLQEVAMVKEESRGYVITLSGSVLFAPGKSELMQTAERRLTQVADALKKQGDDANIVIEGHTDSRGSSSYNEQLSLDRAKSVQTYLLSQGIDAGRLSAIGAGENDPVASNDTPEGRANNRRVEIIVKDGEDAKATQTLGQTESSQPDQPSPPRRVTQR